MIATYISPTGDYQGIYADILQQPHTLIAGQTGSGKSVIANAIIQCALLSSPAELKLILIDPKKVELIDYADFPHCIQYASEPADMVKALQSAIDITQDRFTDMQQKHIKKSDAPHLYVIIDELADLMTTQARQVTPIITRIGQIGRAARVHLIVCTQHILSEVIPTPIKVNLAAVVGLHTRTAQDSRTIIGQSGCEKLPRYGACLYMRPGDAAPQQVRITYAGDEAQAAETRRLLSWWTDPAHIQTHATPEERQEILKRIYGH